MAPAVWERASSGNHFTRGAEAQRRRESCRLGLCASALSLLRLWTPGNDLRKQRTRPLHRFSIASHSVPSTVHEPNAFYRPTLPPIVLVKRSPRTRDSFDSTAKLRRRSTGAGSACVLYTRRHHHEGKYVSTIFSSSYRMNPTNEALLTNPTETPRRWIPQRFSSPFIGTVLTRLSTTPFSIPHRIRKRIPRKS